VDERHEGAGQRRPQSSELDGWWAEAYAPEVGWALVTVRNTAAIQPGNAVEAEALYERLECEVIPEFYNRQ